METGRAVVDGRKIEDAEGAVALCSWTRPANAATDYGDFAQCGRRVRDVILLLQKIWRAREIGTWLELLPAVQISSRAVACAP